MYVTKVDEKLDLIDDKNDLKQIFEDAMNNVDISEHGEYIKIKSGYGVLTTKIVLVKLVDYETLEIEAVNIDPNQDKLGESEEYVLGNLSDAVYLSFALVSGISFDRAEVLHQFYNMNMSNSQKLGDNVSFGHNKVLIEDGETVFNVEVIRKPNSNKVIVSKGIESGIIPDEAYTIVEGVRTTRTGRSLKVGYKNTVMYIERPI